MDNSNNKYKAHLLANHIISFRPGLRNMALLCLEWLADKQLTIPQTTFNITNVDGVTFHIKLYENGKKVDKNVAESLIFYLNENTF